MLKLNSRELPMVNVRCALPAFLAGGDPCFIEFNARAGGAVNTAYLARVEASVLSARIMDRLNDDIADIAEKVTAADASLRAVGRAQFGLVYDTCIIDWQTNIQSDGKPIEATKENFVALSEVRIPSIARAIAKLIKAIDEAGKAVMADDEATLKNL